jgi:hypothetical protein
MSTTVYRKQGSIWESLLVRALQSDGTPMPVDGLTELFITIRDARSGRHVVVNDSVAYDTGTGWGTYDWGTWALSTVGDFDCFLTYPYSSGANPAIAPSRGALRLVVEAA